MQIFYTVQPGDTLFQIANRFGVPIQMVIAANNITNPNAIFIGQQLSIPPGITRYQVKQGDSVYGIATQFRIPLTTIIEANNLQTPYTIYPGQLLNIPPGNPFYTVQPGDSLYQIGLRYQVITSGRVNTEIIQSANNLSTTQIFPGMRLTIPYAPIGEEGIIAYTTEGNEGYDIWLYDVANGNTHRIVRGLAEAFSIPYWSPDGEQIAFIGENNIIYVVHVSSGVIATIDQLSQGYGVYINWAPNSQQIVYAKQNSIIIYNVNTHRFQELHISGATDVQWFPDGEHLLFQALDENGLSQLFRIRTDGTDLSRLTNNTGGRLNEVRLSPNGQFALYTTPGASISIIHVVDLSTGNTIEIDGGPLAKNYFPTWASNSTTIAYSATAFEDRGYFSLIQVTDNEGGRTQTIGISNCFSTPLDWSPDGMNVAYLSGCSNTATATELWVSNINLPAPRKLITERSILALKWKPSKNNGSLSTFKNTQFQIQFQYPSSWEQITPERYEGTNGFFQISAISTPASIEVVCQNKAFHQLMPYGSNPRIQHTTIQNQEGCFIFPSNDQPTEMNNQSALIIQYPEPIQIEGTSYQYFILWADTSHIREIGESIIFL
ncbi:LysM peptidoglycan-binding domain-containing protein [Ornithinibacillus halotolerans]|uniref:LysM domain-containing protein n=1 Tax=Ornithinibacillus halotolerans TaxID=1274357 RepID=A0A916WFR7_9BACI|nr:LysM peptidoglycan-binding domain-containing protein [Ornithinibacillus halotolerans]GGA93165.1 hypothetical protein GCM10008025_39440 [Ornithinibacillus halotolerans]